MLLLMICGIHSNLVDNVSPFLVLWNTTSYLSSPCCVVAWARSLFSLKWSMASCTLNMCMCRVSWKSGKPCTSIFSPALHSKIRKGRCFRCEMIGMIPGMMSDVEGRGGWWHYTDWYWWWFASTCHSLLYLNVCGHDIVTQFYYVCACMRDRQTLRDREMSKCDGRHTSFEPLLFSFTSTQPSMNTLGYHGLWMWLSNDSHLAFIVSPLPSVVFTLLLFGQSLYLLMESCM